LRERGCNPFAPLAGRRWPRSGRMRGYAKLSE
jgi:hypothetical protein